MSASEVGESKKSVNPLTVGTVSLFDDTIALLEKLWHERVTKIHPFVGIERAQHWHRFEQLLVHNTLLVGAFQNDAPERLTVLKRRRGKSF